MCARRGLLVNWPVAFPPVAKAVQDEAVPETPVPSFGSVARVAAFWLLARLLPVGALRIGLGGAEDVFARLATLFSKAAVVTFGGAYAALAYVAQQRNSYQPPWPNPAGTCR